MNASAGAVPPTAHYMKNKRIAVNDSMINAYEELSLIGISAIPRIPDLPYGRSELLFEEWS